MIMQQCGYVNMPINSNNNLGSYKAWFSNGWSSQPSSNFKSLKLTCGELAQGHEAKSLEQARHLVPGSLGTSLHFNASARCLRWSSLFLYKKVFLLLHLENIKTSKAQDVKESSFKLTLLFHQWWCRETCATSQPGVLLSSFSFYPLSHNNTVVAPLTHMITKD